MRIEVDQSGKIEQTWLDTVIAFSNGIQYSVLLPAKAKKRLIQRHRSERQILLKLFVICIYYVIKDYLDELELIIIDNEYEGKQNYIKSSLLRLIRRDSPHFSSKSIRIAQITKMSDAHAVAISITRGHSKSQKTLSEKDVEQMMSQGARR